MKEAEGVVEYVSRVETIVNQLGRNGETLPTLPIGGENLEVINRRIQQYSLCNRGIKGLDSALGGKACWVA